MALTPFPGTTTTTKKVGGLTPFPKSASRPPVALAPTSQSGTTGTLNTPPPPPEKKGFFSTVFGAANKALKAGDKVLKKAGEFFAERHIQAQKTGPYAVQKKVAETIMLKTLNTPAGKKVATKLASWTSDLPVKYVSGIMSLHPDITYREAYNAYNAKIDDFAEDHGVLGRVTKTVLTSAPQSAIGVALSFVPVLGKPMSYVYFTALSADDQIKKYGEVKSVGNIAIDVVGDAMLGGAMQKMLGTEGKFLLKTLKSAGIEGNTEVAQTLLKLANDYKNATTQEERDRIIAEGKRYIKSGDIAVEFGAGAIAGGGIGLVGGAISNPNLTAASQTVNVNVEEQERAPQLPQQLPPPPMPRIPGSVAGAGGLTVEQIRPQDAPVTLKTAQGETITLKRSDAIVQSASKAISEGKSMEEFLEEQTNAFHGGSDVSAGIELGKSNYANTFFATDSADYAKGYGGKGAIVNDIHIKPDAKLIDIKNAIPEQISAIRQKIQETKDAHTPYSGEGGFNPTYGTTVDELIDGAIRGKSHYAEDPALIEIYKQLGYDGMVSYEDVGRRGKNIGVWNKEKILTKSQLTALYKAATGLVPKGELRTAKNETQAEKVKSAVAKSPKSIKEIASATGILEPNIRRILGVGAKEGTFTRVDDGVYVLSHNGKDIAYIEAGDAVNVLPKLVAQGKKYDSVILDPAYFSRALIGGNRGIKAYEFISPENFRKVMNSVAKLVENDTHVYLMLSGARTAQADMEKYAKASVDAGFTAIGEGSYTKLFKDGTPVTNVRGVTAAAERIILMSKSGKVRKGEVAVGNLKFRFLRPSIAKSYATEKPSELMDALIRRSTIKGQSVLDPFAGSGVTGESALKAGRSPTLIEKSEKAVKELIVPRLTKAAGGTQTGKVATPQVEKTTAPPEPIAPAKKKRSDTPSGLALSIAQDNLSKKMMKELTEVAGYSATTIAEQSALAAELLTDIDKTRAVIRGDEELPPGLRGSYLIFAAEDYLKKHNNPDMVMELLSSPLVSFVSQSASELSMLQNREKDGPVKRLEHIKAIRTKKAERTVSTETKKTARSVTTETKKNNLSKDDTIWETFLDEIKC